jgi:hypothetical protein
LLLSCCYRVCTLASQFGPGVVVVVCSARSEVQFQTPFRADKYHWKPVAKRCYLSSDG